MIAADSMWVDQLCLREFVSKVQRREGMRLVTGLVERKKWPVR